MKNFFGALTVGGCIGYFIPQKIWFNTFDNIANTFTFKTNSRQIIELNHSKKWFAKLSQKEILMPKEIKDRFLKTEDGNLLLQYENHLGVDMDDTIAGMLFLYKGSANCQGHTNIVHGGLNLTLSEIFARHYFRILFGTDVQFESFLIKYIKPVNCYEKYLVIGKHGEDEKGKKLDLTTHDLDGKVVQTYTVYVSKANN